MFLDVVHGGFCQKIFGECRGPVAQDGSVMTKMFKVVLVIILLSPLGIS